jgi:hypothetical protein
METKKTIKINVSMRVILIAMTIGIWITVLQNAGIIPTKQNVFVKGGYLRISGNVDVDKINNSVTVDGDVDVDIKRINGKRNVFYQDRDGEYMVLPVTLR